MMDYSFVYLIGIAFWIYLFTVGSAILAARKQRVVWAWALLTSHRRTADDVPHTISGSRSRKPDHRNFPYFAPLGGHLIGPTGGIFTLRRT